MKIARLSIKNFLGITEAVIVPGKVNVLSGKNGQGKSSVLKAIQAAFKGTTPQEIHKGTERAEIIVELEDLMVTRVQTHKTSSVVVKTKDGFTRNAPQKFLDGLLGGFAFNPLSFLLAETKDRKAYLLKAMDVTVTREAINQEATRIVEDPLLQVPVPESGPALEQYAEAHRFFYTRRTDTNRKLKQKQAEADGTRAKLPVEYRPVDGIDEMALVTDELISETEARIAGLEADKRAAEKAAAMRATIGERLKQDMAFVLESRKALDSSPAPDLAPFKKAVEELRRQLETAEHILAAATEIVAERNDLECQIAAMEKDIASDKSTLTALPGAFDGSILSQAEAELAGFKGQRKDVVDEKARQRVWNEHRGLVEEVKVHRKDAALLDALVDLFGRDLPAKALAEAKMPVKGLQISDGGIAVGGVPIDDLATSEQINVTLSIARALSRDLPLVCIDGVERLDEETFAEFVKQAQADGFQYFVTRVGRPVEGELEVAGGKVAPA